jgi:hypothetical protein
VAYPDAATLSWRINKRNGTVSFKEILLQELVHANLNNFIKQDIISDAENGAARGEATNDRGALHAPAQHLQNFRRLIRQS